MQTVCHRGIAVGLDHPAVWIDRGSQIVRDLIDIFAHADISPQCLRHLIANHRRLIAGHYELAGRNFSGRQGCLMYVLTEPLGSRQIRTRSELTRFFGRARGFPGWFNHVAAKDSPEYQPAKWIVRLVDGQFCEQARARYGRSCEFFDYDLVVAVARQVLLQREVAHQWVLAESIAN